jgi:hypothetical protein
MRAARLRDAAWRGTATAISSRRMNNGVESRTSEARPGAFGETVERPWLEQRIEAAISARTGVGNVVLVVGEPGSGKTTLSSQLAASWGCPYAILRAGSTDSALAGDPKNAIVALGLQIRALYGAEVFGPPVVELTAQVDVDSAAASADVVGARIGVVRVSPFKRVLVEADVRVAALHGAAAAIEIGELHDVVASLSAARLAEEAIADPLRRLAELRPAEAVRMIVDGLDENPDLARALPFGPELPPNASWLLTSRPGSHLDRFVTQAGFDVVRIDLRMADAETLSISDAERYLTNCLDRPGFREALERSPYAVRPVGDVARSVAEASGGNFLYVHHWLVEAERAAAANALTAALLETADLPRGLDGIYRYVVSARIRGPAGAAWSSTYVPALGVLAVALRPLTSSQIAQFAQASPQSVDDVLQTVEQFVDAEPLDGDVGYALYHRSFGEFLLTQDRSRNPTPLEPGSAYHRLIADSCIAANRNRWPSSVDTYSLENLPHHLAEAGMFPELGILMNEPFAGRQQEVLGAEAAAASCEFGARRAAQSSRDDAMIDLLGRRTELERGFVEQWESGEFVLSVLESPAGARLEQRFGPAVPWSAFLAAERLLDLDEMDNAKRMLHDIARKGWPTHRPERPRSFGLGEGSAFDFADTDVADFLARVAAIDAELALRLTGRLYVDAVDRLPNRQSAWRDVLLAFLDREPPSASSRQVAEATVEWLSGMRPAPGQAGVAEALFALLARASEGWGGDEEPLERAVTFATKLRIGAPSEVAGDVSYDNVAGVLDGLLAIRDALPTTSHLRKVLAEIVAETAAEIPPLEAPTTPIYHRRAAALGRFAHVLARLDAPEADAAAAAALTACSLDGTTDDPPLDEVATGLAWLLRGGGSVSERARSLVAELDLADRVSDAERTLEQPWQSGRSKEIGVPGDPFSTVFGPYARGRLALSIWRTGTLTLDELRERMRKASARSVAQQNDEQPPAVKDLALEGLASALVSCPTAWALTEVRNLNAARTGERSTDVDLDEARLRQKRWTALSSSGANELLEAEVVAARSQTPPDDVNGQVDCCWGALYFDPDLADSWWAELATDLDPLDRGGATTVLVDHLANEHPERMDDLGRRWVDRLPQREPEEPVATFELLLCRWWARHPLLHDAVTLVLDRLARSVPTEFERVSVDGSDDGWPHIGAMLRAGGGVRSTDGAAATAAERLADAVLTVWRSRSDPDESATRAAGILAGFVDRDAGELVDGPAGHAAETLLDEVAALLANDDSNRAEILGTERDVAMHAATLLKSTAPTVAGQIFDTEWSAWKRGIAQTTREPAGSLLESLPGILAAAFEEEFRSPAERMLFNRTKGLCSWCAEKPPNLEQLAMIQRDIGLLTDVDLRALLMGPVAAAWLDVRQLARAAAVADAATTQGLALAGFYRRLPAVASAPDGGTELRTLLLEAAVRTTTEGATPADEALRSWLTFRARETSRSKRGTSELDPDYLTALVDWILGRKDERMHTMEPITLAGVGSVAITEGIKFLYGQAGELLKRWKNRDKEPDAEPPRLAPAPPDLLEGTVQPTLAKLEVVGRFEDELRELWQALAPYAAGIEDVDENDAEVVAATDALRRILEAVFAQRITFKGEQREPSGPVVVGEVNIDEIAGDVAGVRARLISSGRIAGHVTARTAEKGSRVSGVEADEIG